MAIGCMEGGRSKKKKKREFSCGTVLHAEIFLVFHEFGPRTVILNCSVSCVLVLYKLCIAGTRRTAVVRIINM